MQCTVVIPTFRDARIAQALDSIAAQKNIQPEQAFVLRTLLIHDYRRALLTDPNLPTELLGAEWPGYAAYTLSQAIYKKIEKAADKQVATILSLEHQDVPPIDKRFTQRFR